MLLRNTPHHQFALLKLTLALGANCRYVQGAGGPTPLPERERELPARTVALGHHAAVVAIENIFEHVTELPLALHRVAVRTHGGIVLVESSAKAALRLGRQALTGSRQHFRKRPLCY